MSGQNEMRPVRGGCRHLRARYKTSRRGKSPFPELEFVRNECEQGQPVESDEDLQKCMESHLKCWRKA
jgi:hypothetical protein